LNLIQAPPDVLTPDELHAAIGSLSDLDYVAVEKATVYWSTGRAISADDLLLKAMTNSLSGARKCPRDLPVKEFLIGAMRSLASSSYKGSKRDPLIIGRAVEDQEEEVSLAHGTAASSEDILIAEERQAAMRTALVSLFKDDPEADLVLTGLLQDMSREEIQKDCNLTDTEYETIRRRIRRAINKHYPKGWPA
jgi:RNA polymerase sigma-70 factor (ECF subfamily)